MPPGQPVILFWWFVCLFVFSCFKNIHLKGMFKIVSLVGTLSDVLRLRTHLPSKDGEMAGEHVRALWGSLPPPRSSPVGAGTRSSPGRWMEVLVSHSLSLVLALERLSNSYPVNYVPFLKKVD